MTTERAVILVKNMYLLTEWEGRTGKYFAWGQSVGIVGSEPRTSWPRAKYFPFRPDLTQSIRILSYDHLLLKILNFCLNLNKIRRPRAVQFHKSFYNTICHSFLRVEQETHNSSKSTSQFLIFVFQLQFVLKSQQKVEIKLSKTCQGQA